ncbi:hypothetical protein Tco_0017459, partial [Tanacetum coccineum]
FAKGDVPREDDFVCFEVEASKPTMMVKGLEDRWSYGELRPKRWGEGELEIEELLENGMWWGKGGHRLGLSMWAGIDGLVSDKGIGIGLVMARRIGWVCGRTCDVEGFVGGGVGGGVYSTAMIAELVY